MRTKRSIACWVDLEDGHYYAYGDVYPHDGRAVADERIKELSSVDNNAGFPLIEITDEEESVETDRQPKNAVKTAKKNA